MSGHKLNLPWSFDGRTIFDSQGVPVMVALAYTSLRSEDGEGFKTYNSSDYAGEIRARLVVEAMNAEAGE